jgi:DNA-binding beta-propeller fold protein YncE
MQRIATLLAAGVLAALALPGSASAAFGPAGSFGGTGAGVGQLNHPEGIVVDPGSGNVYVADSGNSRLEGFTSNGSGATVLTSGRGDFHPTDVAIGPGGNQWTVSPGRVDQFALGLAIGGFTTVANAGGIAVDGSGNVYVSDSSAGRIHVYNALGIETTSWGTQGTGFGQMLHPQGLTTDAAGNVYVADPDALRIDKFTSTGTFVTAWGMPLYAGAVAGVAYPHDVAVDSSGRVFAPDALAGSIVVLVFTSGGTLQQIFGSPDPDTSGACPLRTPWGVAVGPSGGLYVSSTGEDRIRAFDEAHTACPTPNFGTAGTSGGGGGNGGGPSGGSGGAAGAGGSGVTGPDTTRPQIQLTGFPRHCARQNFFFQIHVTDDVLISSLQLLINGRRAANQQPGQPAWDIRVRMPVQTVRKQLPKGAKFKITVEVKASDSSGKQSDLKRAFRICA